MGEATRIFRTVPMKDAAWYTATFEVDLKRVLDLAAPPVLNRLGVVLADLLQQGPAGYRLPQAIATEARVRGFSGILAPTARPGLSGANLVVFLEVLAESGGSVKQVR
jgi:hypothetical protein